MKNMHTQTIRRSKGRSYVELFISLFHTILLNKMNRLILINPGNISDYDLAQMNLLHGGLSYK